MIDPVSALSVAGVVVQFVELGVTILSKGYKISKSANGILPENIETEDITGDLLILSERLGALPASGSVRHTPTPDEAALEEMAGGCKAIAQELLDALEQLKPKAGQRKWKNYWEALKCVMTEDKLDGLARRLSNYRDELQLRILVSLRY